MEALAKQTLELVRKDSDLTIHGFRKGMGGAGW